MTQEIYEQHNEFDLLDELLDEPINFYPCLAIYAGSVKAGLMLSVAVHQNTDADGWFPMSAKQWTEITGLTLNEQKTARAKLRGEGAIEEELRHHNGVPTVHFRVNKDDLKEFMFYATVYARLYAKGRSENDS